MATVGFALLLDRRLYLITRTWGSVKPVTKNFVVCKYAASPASDLNNSHFIPHGHAASHQTQCVYIQLEAARSGP